MSYRHILNLEKELSDFTGAPFVIPTDCLTHALEVCLRIIKPAKVTSTAYTYISVPMVFKKLNIAHEFNQEKWIGKYKFHGTKIWDCARLLSPKMYEPKQIQLLSFGNGKPLDNKRGGAILCDNEDFYYTAKKMCYDGRDMTTEPWINQRWFKVGYHYNMPFEHAESCSILLKQYIKKGNFHPQEKTYPDCSSIRFLD